jgi:prepilin-type N-terminal cleavage/methylation domain-containing protein
MARKRPARGFTLIEVMVSAAIVGILASVAIPAFGKSTLRTKVAERRIIMLRVKQAVQDYYVRNGETVPGGGTLDSGYNPPLPPIPQKRAMLTTSAAWNTYFSSPGGGSSLPVEVEGGVYYSYRFVVQDTPAAGTITVYAAGDLDGDSVVSYKQLVFTRLSGMYQLTAESPAEGQEDDASPYATF